MNEREPKTPRAHEDFPLSVSGRGSGGGVNSDPREERLRELYAAVYPPTYPSVKPSEGLRRRVAAVMAQSDAQTARRRSSWRLLTIRPIPVLGAVAAMFLIAVVSLVFVRRGYEASREPHAPRIALHPQPDRMAERPLSVSPRVQKEPARQVVAAPRATQPSVSRRDAASGERRRTQLIASGSDAPREARQRLGLSSDAGDEIVARLRRSVRSRDDFVRIPFPRLASASGQQIAEAVESYKREAAIVDSRLTREVTLQQKATALSDLCERLRADTGIHLVAGSSVADEKVTVLCEKLPLRDVMRQLSRPFGYAWLRSGKEGEYKYDLVQDLRSQLLEEELRNRDHNAALLALEKEIERYRPYLHLSPDEALAQAKTAPPAVKPLLQKLAATGWGPIHIYFRLSPQQMASLRTEGVLAFSMDPYPVQYPLPPDMARGVLQSIREYRVVKTESVLEATGDLNDSRAQPMSAFPEMGAQIRLYLKQSELGQFELSGQAGFYTPGKTSDLVYGGPTAGTYGITYAVGRSPSALRPENEVANAKMAHDPALRSRITVQPQPSCGLSASLAAAKREENGGPAPEPKVTSADVLEAFHRASGLPIVADCYTRLHKPEAVSVRGQPLFDALNRLADEMRLRWNKDGAWLQLRSSSYFHDRLKEVPNRLLRRWAEARRQHGMLNLDDLVEIAQLPDPQLDGAEMAEGAKSCFGLPEWDLGRDNSLRPHLRYLAGFTPAQRQEAASPKGLAFTAMSLAQQQQFIANALYVYGAPLQSLDELAGAALRVDYTQPGWFEWLPPQNAAYRWVLPEEPGPQGRRALRAPVRARTREAALAAARRAEPQVREALVKLARSQQFPEGEVDRSLQEAEVVPTRLYLTIVYIPGASNKHPLHVFEPNGCALYFGTP